VQLTRNYGLRGIALSGYGMTEDLARTTDAGFLAHLVKPIDFERLNQVIDKVGEAA
jgi:CheY-like chemotaxis protein